MGLEAHDKEKNLLVYGKAIHDLNEKIGLHRNFVPYFQNLLVDQLEKHTIQLEHLHLENEEVQRAFTDIISDSLIAIRENKFDQVAFENQMADWHKTLKESSPTSPIASSRALAARNQAQVRDGIIEKLANGSFGTTRGNTLFQASSDDVALALRHVTVFTHEIDQAGTYVLSHVDIRNPRDINSRISTAHEAIQTNGVNGKVTLLIPASSQGHWLRLRVEIDKQIIQSVTIVDPQSSGSMVFANRVKAAVGEGVEVKGINEGDQKDNVLCGDWTIRGIMLDLLAAGKLKENDITKIDPNERDVKSHLRLAVAKEIAENHPRLSVEMATIKLPQVRDRAPVVNRPVSAIAPLTSEEQTSLDKIMNVLVESGTPENLRHVSDFDGKLAGRFQALLRANPNASVEKENRLFNDALAQTYREVKSQSEDSSTPSSCRSEARNTEQKGGPTLTPATPICVM